MKWKPVDVIVAIIVCTLSVGLIGVGALPLITGEPPTDERSRVIAGVVSALIAIVSTYVGSKIRQRDKDDDDERK